MDCKHEFIGNAEGVKCSLCGLSMTREEYREYLKGGKEKAPTNVAVEAPKKPAAKKTVKPKK